MLCGRKPNFKNFLSLHIFAQSLAAQTLATQSLAEQKHALKISEHTFIIMCNYNGPFALQIKFWSRQISSQLERASQN
jgi:hypothetical protein